MLGAHRSHIYDLQDIPQEYRAAFASAKGGSEAIIGPGDSLVIPNHWWHRERSHTDDDSALLPYCTVPCPSLLLAKDKTRRPPLPRQC